MKALELLAEATTGSCTLPVGSRSEPCNIMPSGIDYIAFLPAKSMLCLRSMELL